MEPIIKLSASTLYDSHVKMLHFFTNKKAALGFRTTLHGRESHHFLTLLVHHGDGMQQNARLLFPTNSASIQHKLPLHKGNVSEIRNPKADLSDWEVHLSIKFVHVILRYPGPVLELLIAALVYKDGVVCHTILHLS